MRRTYPWFAIAAAVALAAACSAALAAELPADLAALYAYDKAAPLNVTVSDTKPSAKTTEERIEFDSPKGGRVAGLFIRPNSGPKPWVILALHGLGGDKSFARPVAALVASKGYAVLGLDAALHGDRKIPGEEMFGPDMKVTRDAMIQTVIDYRRAMDYLETLPDVHHEAFGLCGASMGAMQGTIVAAVDPRVAATLLVVGGGGWQKIIATSTHPAVKVLKQLLKDPAVAAEADKIDPLAYVPYISPRPVWFLNGREDTIIPPAAAKALQDAAGEPKHIVWYDGGHMPPIPVVMKTMSEWLTQSLRPALDKTLSQEVPAAQ